MNNWTLIIGILLFVCSLSIGQQNPRIDSDSLKSRLTDTTFSAPFSEISTAGIDSEHDFEKPGTTLPFFGFDLFGSDAPAQIGESEALVLPANYTLGPGDRIGVYLLGNVQKSLDLTVNVEGKVFLPPAGVMKAWGLTIDEFRSVLNRALSKYYDNFSLDMMLLQPKNVAIAVVGDVKRPGKYVMSALNTVLDAVTAAGGPTPKGSLRDVQLIRDDEAIVSVDLYSFLMSGKNRYDDFLQTGDRIYVPLRQSTVRISGEVMRQSQFELKPGAEETIVDLIELAGGFTDYAYLRRLEIQRLEDDGNRKVMHFDYHAFTAGDSTQNLVLSNEDRIQVYSLEEQINDRKVSIYGEIRRPGEYDLANAMHLSDLILMAGNYTRKAYTLEAEIAKVDPGEPTRFVKVNLDQLGAPGTNGDVDVLLEEDDQVFIRQIPDWETGLLVDVQGEVVFPGKYPIAKEQTYLSEIIDKAGGFTKEAFPQEAVVIRPSTRVKFDKEFERLASMKREEMSDLEYQYLVMRQNSVDVEEIVVDFEKLVFQGDKTQDIVLEKGDIIRVPKAPKVVTVTGRVSKPGGVTYTSGQNLAYYLAQAGGPSWDASLSKTKVIKVTGEVIDDEAIKEFEPGDIIWVPRKSDVKIWPTVIQTVAVVAQVASILFIIDTAIERRQEP
jgi:protein involved in polysaccharide export with SLBB domain